MSKLETVVSKLNYEFSDYEEANRAIEDYKKSKPPDVAPYPEFEIDYVDVINSGELTIWLKLKRGGSR